MAPQRPQFALVFSGVSQPLVAFPSQLPLPSTQVHPQLEAVQLGRVFGPEVLVQRLPQRPQLSALDSRSASQPSVAAMLQLAHPEAHAVIAHCAGVPRQDAVAFGSMQLTPQAPQLGGALSGASQPLEGFPSQLPKPGLQLPTTQLPPVQPATALGIAHRLPQLPQLAGSLVVLASQPSPDIRLQSW